MPGGRPDDQGLYLLDLVVGGHTYRFAEETVEVVDAEGRTLRYLEGLLEPGLTYGSLIGVQDASVALELQAEGVDWALLIERGHAIDRAPAVLRRWYPGRTLDRARVVLRGLVDAPSYGAEGEPLTMSVLRSPRSQSRMLPPPQAVVDSNTWPATVSSPVHEIPEKALGATYPLVIGCPGGTAAATPKCVVPVPQAEWRVATPSTSRAIWLGGHASQVRVQIADGTETDEATGAIDDLLGREVQYALTPDDDIEGTYLIGFRDDATYGGGIVYRGTMLRGAGDVIEWVLREYYDGAVDFGRLAAVRAYLNQFKIDTYINSPVSAWDWMVKEILPLLPVEMREGPAGLYPALLRFDLTARDAVARLDATAGAGRVTRASPVSMVSDIANEVTIDFRPLAETGAQWMSRRVFSARAGLLSGADATDVEDGRVIGSYLCAESQRRYGIRPERVQASAVWDTTTAILMARHIVARRAWPRRAVRYTGGSWLEELEVGSAVLLSDPEIHVSEAVALVADVVPGAESAVDLLLLDHPVDRARST